MRKTAFLCFLILLLAALTVTVLATDTLTVIDDMDLLTDEQEAALSASLQKEPETGVSFYLYTMSTANADDYPTDRAVRIYCGIPDSEAAVVLVVRKAHTTYYYDMYTYGDAWDMFSDADVDRILDSFGVYNSLKSGRIYEGADSFFTLCRQTVQDFRQKEADRVAREPLMIALTGTVVAILAAGIAVLVVVLRYRTKKHGESYPLDHYARLDLTYRDDRFVGSHVTRVRIQSSSGGGRSGGGGGGGGRRGGR